MKSVFFEHGDAVIIGNGELKGCEGVFDHYLGRNLAVVKAKGGRVVSSSGGPLAVHVLASKLRSAKEKKK